MQGFSLCHSVDCRQSFAGTSVSPSQAGSRPPCSLRTPVQMAQSLQGKVVSTSAAKTAVIAVETMVPHRLYQKRMRQTTKYAAHDETNKCTVGDYVEILPSKPMSRSKRFVVGEILRTSEL